MLFQRVMFEVDYVISIIFLFTLAAILLRKRLYRQTPIFYYRQY